MKESEMKQIRIQKSKLRDLIAADGLATLLFVVGQAACDELSRKLATRVGLVPAGAGLALIVLLLLLMDPLCAALGGALFNPANNATLYATGQGSLLEHSGRALGQCVGAAAGVVLARMVLPEAWQTGLPAYALGLRRGVLLLEGAACELLLGMLLAFLVLFSAGCRSRFWKTWLPLLATVVAVKGGSGYTGPSLNPAVAFGWSLAYPQQSPLEHTLVFWAAPLLSGVMGGWAYLGMKQWAGQRKHAGKQQHVRRRQQQQQKMKNKEQ